MLTPETIQELHDLDSEDLRQLIAHAAGIHAHRDQDGGIQIGDALIRVAFRLRYQPRNSDVLHS